MYQKVIEIKRLFIVSIPVGALPDRSRTLWSQVEERLSFSQDNLNTVYIIYFGKGHFLINQLALYNFIFW